MNSICERMQRELDALNYDQTAALMREFAETARPFLAEMRGVPYPETDAPRIVTMFDLYDTTVATADEAADAIERGDEERLAELERETNRAGTRADRLAVALGADCLNR